MKLLPRFSSLFLLFNSLNVYSQTIGFEGIPSVGCGGSKGTSSGSALITTPNIPAGWRTSENLPWEVTNTNPSSRTGTRCIHVCTNFTNGYLVTSANNLTAGVTYQLKFYFRTVCLSTCSGGVTLKIGYNNDQSKTMFNSQDVVNNQKHDDWKEYTYSFTPTTTGVYYFVFQMVFNGNVTNRQDYAAIDDMVLVNYEHPLPVQLKSIAANCQDNKREIVWETESEMNNAFYFIERSFDGLNWEIIGRENGKGNSHALSSYKYIDDEPVEAKNLYYRLSQQDFDGTIEVLNVVAAKCLNEAIMSLKLYPNPTKDFLTVELNVKEALSEVSLKLYDITGKILKIEKLNLVKGTNICKVNLQSFVAGTYFLKVVSDEFNIPPQKFIVH